LWELRFQFQGIDASPFRNPIVEPGLVGTSSGAHTVLHLFCDGKSLSGPLVDLSAIHAATFCICRWATRNAHRVSIIECVWKTNVNTLLLAE
jgi:hypothetical protein